MTITITIMLDCIEDSAPATEYEYGSLEILENQCVGDAQMSDIGLCTHWG